MAPAISQAVLAESFLRSFGQQAHIFAAPGRVNLIGEHTDYNEGFVLPAAVEFRTLAAIGSRADHTLKLVSMDYSEERDFDLRNLPAEPQGHWSDYVIGVARQLSLRGISLRGANLMLHGDVPVGAGLSSSASVEVACALALLSNAGAALDRVELALCCQSAENEFVGARCGIMDQFVSANGRAGHALLLDCRSLEYQLVHIPPQLAIVICNTMVKHRLAGGEYNRRREQCEQGVTILQRAFPRLRSLRDATVAELELQRANMPDVILRRCRHVIVENARVLETAAALESSNLDCIGRLMAESHRSLREDFEVSSAELDLMVELANEQPGVVGARMTGAGFGGCTVNLVHSNAAESFKNSVRDAYTARTGVVPETYISKAADGAREIFS